MNEFISKIIDGLIKGFVFFQQIIKIKFKDFIFTKKICWKSFNGISKKRIKKFLNIKFQINLFKYW